MPQPQSTQPPPTAARHTPDIIDQAAAAWLGPRHPDHWMKALWLLESFPPEVSKAWSAPLRARGSRPPYVRAKAKAYLDAISDPQGDAAEILIWRIEEGVGLQAALAWWVQRQTGLVPAKVLPETLLTAAAGLQGRHRTLKDVHAELRRVVEAFATVRDTSFTAKEIRADLDIHLRRSGAPILRRSIARLHPASFPELLTPPR